MVRHVLLYALGAVLATTKSCSWRWGWGRVVVVERTEDKHANKEISTLIFERKLATNKIKWEGNLDWRMRKGL